MTSESQCNMHDIQRFVITISNNNEWLYSCVFGWGLHKEISLQELNARFTVGLYAIMNSKIKINEHLIDIYTAQCYIQSFFRYLYF